MSKIKVNSIEASTGSTITIPSGQTLDISATTLTLPSTVVTTTGTQTLTNKTIGVSQLSGTLPVANGGTGLTTLGTAEQVLRVNSGATALEFATPSAGAFNLLASTGAGSTVASADLNGYFTSDYDVYEIFIVNLIGSTNTTLRLRFATGGGYSVQTGSDYNTEQNYNSGGAVSANPYSSTSAYQLVHIGSSATFSTTSRITLFKPTSSSQKKNIHSFSLGNYDGNRYFVNAAGYWNSATAVTGVRILSEAGTITYDNIYLYGIKNS
jgi:hypothetical protein